MDVFAGSVYDVALCIPPTPKPIFGYRSSPAVPLRNETDIFGQVSEYDTKIIHLDLDKRKGLVRFLVTRVGKKQLHSSIGLKG